MRFIYRTALVAAIATLLAGPARTHEGHDHAAAPPVTVATLPRADASSEAFELVAVARNQELLVYLDRFASNEPVEGATIELDTPAGPVTMQAEAGQPYRLSAPWLSKPGRIDLVATVTAGDVVDILPLSLTIPNGEAVSAASRASAPAPWLDELRATIGGSPPYSLVALAVVFVLGVIAGSLRGRRRALVVALLAVTALWATTATAHEGDDHGTPAKPAPSMQAGELAQRLPDGKVFVPKATQRIFGIRTAVTASGVYGRTIEMPGRIIPDPHGSGFVQAAVGGRLSPPPGGFPRLGTRVTQGQLLAYVTPPLQAIDISDMRQRQGELDQQIAIVRKRLARYEVLAPSGAVARSALEETQLELEGLLERRASLDKVRRDPEPLNAPVDGIIADGVAVAGQIVAPNAVIFHIVDPKRLWVEALSFEPFAGAPRGSARTADGKTLTLTYEGAGFADRNQAVPVQFSIRADDTPGLRVGQFVSALVTAEEQADGIAVPRTSLVRGSNGQDFVYEHLGAEVFAPIAVRAAPLDGNRVLIAAGLGAGKRVVTQGAELLDHVR